MAQTPGGTLTGAIMSLLETAKPNGIDPEAYLHHVLTHIADHPASRVADLLPWAVTDLPSRLHPNRPRPCPDAYGLEGRNCADWKHQHVVEPTCFIVGQCGHFITGPYV